MNARFRAQGFGLGLVAALLSLGFSTSVPSRETLVGGASVKAIGNRVIELVNEARSKPRRCGTTRYPAAPSLSVASELSKAAASHARDMARRQYFDHRGADGSQPKDRVLRAGYVYSLTGENIAFGPVSAEEVVAGWLASPGHCANIMDARFRHIGVGLATGQRTGHILWVQNFGAPLDPRPPGRKVK